MADQKPVYNTVHTGNNRANILNMGLVRELGISGSLTPGLIKGLCFENLWLIPKMVQTSLNRFEVWFGLFGMG